MWKVDGIQIAKSFSESVYGEAAKDMAVDAREAATASHRRPLSSYGPYGPYETSRGFLVVWYDVKSPKSKAKQKYFTTRGKAEAFASLKRQPLN